MGYYAEYQLKVSDDKALDIISQFRALNSSAEYCLDCDGKRLNNGKWYDHEDDLKALSLRYPNIMFTLDGFGEDCGLDGLDYWRKWFLNGVMKRADAVITFNYPE